MNHLPKYWRISLIWIVILVLGAGLIWPLPTLCIRQYDSDHRLFVPLLKAKTFPSTIFIRYKTPVQENYVLDPGTNCVWFQLIISHTGRPAFLPEEGTLVNDNGKFD